MAGPIRDDANSPAGAWRRFSVSFVATVAALGLAAIAFVAVLDPYGLRATPGRAPGPLMDRNQRFVYPQIARSGAYDAAVIGTSTSRLLDPRDLDEAFGARFANLAMNLATPYEQVTITRLFLRHTKAQAMLFALDVTWCEADADKRLTTSEFPLPFWLYENPPSFALLRQATYQGLTVAGGVLMSRLHLASERMPGNGFRVFTGPESRYDVRKAAAKIHSGRTPLDYVRAPEVPASDDRMPALAWLDELLGEVPAEAVRIVAFMPAHAAAQGQPGTPRGERERACKDEVARIASRRGATLVDFRIPSSVTSEDTNYWDSLHYRLPIAKRIVDGLKAAQGGGGDDPLGFYKVLTVH